MPAKTKTSPSQRGSRKTTRKTEAPMIIRYEPLPVAAAARREPTVEEIARRAYGYFERRGHVHGHHLEDWLRAEHELRSGS